MWAVFSPKFGIETGAVALICAGLFTAEGNNPKNSLKIIFGLIIGIPWGILALRFTPLPGNVSFNQFLILCVLGAIIILICGFTIIGQFIDSTSWLCGWAISILVLGHETMSNWGVLPFHLALSMAAGVFIIGVGGVYFNDWVKKKTSI